MSILKRGAFALFLGSLAVAVAVPGPASAAPIHRPITLLTIQEGRTIQVIGSHFAPGASVTIALLNTRTWRVLSTGRTRSEAAVYGCPLQVNPVCGRPDPSAGRLFFQMVLRQQVSPAALAVLYRSGSQTGFAHVQ